MQNKFSKSLNILLNKIHGMYVRLLTSVKTGRMMIEMVITMMMITNGDIKRM